MAALPNDWQLSCTEMKQRGQYLLQSGQWSDCTFFVGSEPNQIAIRGHRLILAMASPVFEAMFFGGMPERNELIPILDVQPDAFKALLEYIYTDKINISTFDKACELCYGAKKYMLPHLVKECTRYLWSDLSPKNACRAYEFARLFEESVLMNKCIQIISSNTKEVLHDISFLELEPETIITVFSLDELNINTELDLFNAATRYACAYEKRGLDEQIAIETGPRKSPEPSTSKVVNVESSAENSPEVIDPVKISTDQDSQDNQTESESVTDHPAPSPSSEPKLKKPAPDIKEKVKHALRGAIEKIRFLTLLPQQFAEGPAKSALLTESESFAVLMNILSSNSDLPMPAGFSTSRSPRQVKVIDEESLMPTFTVDTPSPVTIEFVDTPRYQRSSINGTEPNFPYGNPRISLVQLPEMNQSTEVRRVYCQRPLLNTTSCLNTSVLDCCVTFMVDKNICLLGVQVPTQAPPPEAGAPPSAGAGYSELLYAHLLDADGARLTYTHYTNRVPYRHLLDIMFNRSVYILRNKVYKVGVVLNKVGWYKMGTCAKQVAAESVFFNFGIGPTADSVRDGLIRSIIFTY